MLGSTCGDGWRGGQQQSRRSVSSRCRAYRKAHVSTMPMPMPMPMLVAIRPVYWQANWLHAGLCGWLRGWLHAWLCGWLHVR